MKKNKLFGLLIACGGMVASFATAAALYTKGVNPVGFGIGAHFNTQDGTITYLINGTDTGTVAGSYLDESGANGGAGLGGDTAVAGHHYTQIHYEFPLSATYSKLAQDYVTGNFSVSLTSIVPELQNKSKIWIELKGFGDEYYQRIGEESIDDPLIHDIAHSAKWGSSAANVKFMNSDETITGATYSNSKDITVETAGGQSVHVYIKLITSGENQFDFSNMLNLAETSPFTMSVTWGGVSAGYEGAYAIGDGTNWEKDELYAMVPNLKSASFQWYFKGLTGWTSGKAFKDNITDPDVWSANPDAELTASTVYNVYWDGSGSSQANFDDPLSH